MGWLGGWRRVVGVPVVVADSVAVRVAVVVVVACGGSEFTSQSSGNTTSSSTSSSSTTTTGAGGASDTTTRTGGAAGDTGGGSVDASGSGGQPTTDAASGSDTSLEASTIDARDARSDAASNARCPPIEPTANGACADGLDCTYGTHPHLACRHEYICSGSHWMSASGMTCPMLGDCNSEQPKPTIGAACPVVQHDCLWSSGLYCRCLPGDNGAMGPTWDCYPSPQGCPTTPPNKGQTCDLSAMTCAYGTCPLGTKVTTSCVGAVVTWTGTCP